MFIIVFSFVKLNKSSICVCLHADTWMMMMMIIIIIIIMIIKSYSANSM